MVFDNIKFIDEFGKEQKLEFNNIYCVDCMKVLKLMPDKSIDLCIVDPPYGLERFKHGGSVINKYGDETRQWNNIKPSADYFKELFRVSKNQIIWGGNNFELPTSEYYIIWDKINPETFSFAMCEMAWTNCKIPAKIFRTNSMQLNRIHPTQKPVALYEWLLNNYAKKGDKILDTHLGSASSIIACKKLGFEYLGFELDSDYFKSASERIAKFESQENLFGILNEIEKPKQESLF